MTTTLSISESRPDPVEVAEYLEFLVEHRKAWEPQAIPYLKKRFRAD